MSEPTKALRRPKQERILAGVCAGLGNFFGISAWWFRAGFLLALIPGGVPGFLLYLICWIIIPSE